MVYRYLSIVLTCSLQSNSFLITIPRKTSIQGIRCLSRMSAIHEEHQPPTTITASPALHDKEPQPIIPAYDFNASKKPEKKGLPFSREILFDYVDHLERHQSELFMDVDNFVVIYDAYPKAKIHLLIIPKRHYLLCNGIEYLMKKDLPKVEEMHRLARRIVDSNAMVIALQQHGSSSTTSSSSGRVRTGTSLLLGFHSVPSLHPLHLHLISDDFNSEALKNKKHWNSFTTEFFVSPAKVEEMLQSRNDDDLSAPLSDVMDTVEEREEVLKCPLRCHCCSFQAKNIPILKSHLLSHCS